MTSSDLPHAPPAIQSRSFLVGCPRSGTTLLQSMLASHSQVLSFPETNYVNTVVGDFHRRVLGRLERRPWSRLRSLRTRLRIAVRLANREARPRFATTMEMIGRPDLAGLLPPGPITIDRAVRALVQGLDRQAADSGFPCWLDKTPTHYAYMREVERACPSARFIHLVRSGSDAVASLYDAARRFPGTFWERDFGTVDDCVACWNNAIRATRSRLDRPAHRVVLFEDLVADPESVLRPLCAWLGLDYEPALVNDYGDTSKRLQLGSETWKSGVAAPIGAESKFERLFSAEQRQAILRRLEPLDAIEQVARGGPGTDVS